MTEEANVSDELAKARAAAAAAKAQRAAMDDAERDYPSSIGMFVGEHTGFVVMPDKMLSAMLDIIEAAEVACKQGRPVDAFQALNDVDDAIRAFRCLMGDNRE